MANTEHTRTRGEAAWLTAAEAVIYTLFNEEVGRAEIFQKRSVEQPTAEIFQEWSVGQPAEDYTGPQGILDGVLISKMYCGTHEELRAIWNSDLELPKSDAGISMGNRALFETFFRLSQRIVSDYFLTELAPKVFGHSVAANKAKSIRTLVEDTVADDIFMTAEAASVVLQPALQTATVEIAERLFKKEKAFGRNVAAACTRQKDFIKLRDEFGYLGLWERWAGIIKEKFDHVLLDAGILIGPSKRVESTGTRAN
ncbi:MAG: hypothetical protein ACR2L1_00270 [Pyrinomonadaceae bacterium]